MAGRGPTTTRRWAWPRTPARTRSRRPTASWPASTTPTATPATSRPRSASRRSRRPTTSSATPTSASSTTAAPVRSRPAARASVASTPAPSPAASATSCPTCSVAERAAVAPAGGGRAGAAAARRARPGDRGADLLRPGGRGRAGARCRCPPRRPARLRRHAAPPGHLAEICPQCQGRGVEVEGQGLFSISQPCSRCGGSGTVIEDPCPTCGGSGARRTVKRYRVSIPAGVRDGSRVRLAGKGEPGPRGGPPGDLYVVTRVADSPIFKRRGDNVEVEVPLTIPEAIRGRHDRGADAARLARSCACPAAPSTAPCSACAARARPSCSGIRPGRHPLSLRDRRARVAVARAAGRGGRAVEGDQRQPARPACSPPAASAASRRRSLMADPASPAPRASRSPADRGVFMISVAAELAEMHPQTLRMYEARGLIEPKRSPKGTRLYSQDDVERLRRIQEMTAELGMNLAGVERVFELEERAGADEPAHRGDGAARRPSSREQMEAEVERVRARVPGRDRALRRARRGAGAGPAGARRQGPDRAPRGPRDLSRGSGTVIAGRWARS